MSSNSHYYSNYNKKFYRGAKEYIENHSIKILLDQFMISEDSDQGKMVIKLLKDKNLMYDSKYISSNILIGNSYVSTCTFCYTKDYAMWKLIGITTEEDCNIIKCILPHLCCEKCFRKRFCYQDQNPHLCGYAVFPSSDYSTEKYKSIGSQPAPRTIHSPPKIPFPAPRNPVPVASPRPTASLHSLNQSPSTSRISKTVITRYSEKSGPIVLAPPSTVVSVKQPIRQSLTSTPSSSSLSTEAKVEEVSTPEVVHETPSPAVSSPVIELPEEYAVTLQCRHNGLFHSWYNSFFVINKTSVIRYPNETRNERKRKEIYLYDATFKHSVIHSDNKRPHCVIIQPGASSDGMKPFIVNLFSEENEETFLNELEAYAKIARLTPPTCYAEEEEESE